MTTSPEPRILLDGLTFGESPRWHDGRLWLSDWGTREIVAVDLRGRREVVARAPSAPCCIDFLPGGRLLLVSGGEGRLLRGAADGALVPFADLRSLSDKPWNEIVAGPEGSGNVYLNNIGFDFPAGDPVPGILALVTPDGAVRQGAGGVACPNGMAVTPDGSTLIVAESYAGRLTAFDIEPGGGLSGRRVWADLGDGAPDGICLDAEGAVWYADVPHRRCVRVRAGGAVLDSVGLDRGCFACALGGPDGRTLFLVANRWSGDVNAPGDGPPGGRVLALTAPAPRATLP
jgi:sugar lactone lactonase YvrE